ncbi:hypothetical protein [Shinella sp. BYT-45]|uniref:hypothetical protein n=1 Tax=Shinella sp. BYT-45 TaxID=3377377 RepID=UPI003980B3F8
MGRSLAYPWNPSTARPRLLFLVAVVLASGAAASSVSSKPQRRGAEMDEQPGNGGSRDVAPCASDVVAISGDPEITVMIERLSVKSARRAGIASAVMEVTTAVRDDLTRRSGHDRDLA